VEIRNNSPLNNNGRETVTKSREELRRILTGESDKKILII